MPDAVRNTNPLREALRACKVHFISAGLCSGLINLLYLIPSIFMLQVYDRVIPTRGGATLIALTLILAVSLIVFATLDAVRMRLLLRASVRLERMAAPNILHRILGANGATAAQRSQAMRHFDTLRGTLAGPAIIALFDAPWAPIYIIVCFLLHPLIGLLALVATIVLSGVAIASDLATRATIHEAQQRSAAAYRIQDYSIQVSEVARVLGMRGALVENHLRDRTDFIQRQSSVAETSGIFLAMTKFLRLLFQSLALALGAWLAINQSISAGSIFAASLILGRALQPVEQILGALKSVLGARDAYRGLDAFCSQPDVTVARTALPTPRGHIAVSNVTVRVPGSDQMILKNISFTVEPGQIVALVGGSGAGKSSLLRVLSGAIEPDQGEVRIDGARLTEWNREDLGKHIGYMPQTPSLFPASIRTNIARFQIVSADEGLLLDQEIVAAAQLAGAHELILRFSQGYETELFVRDGSGLSAGQRQVVALSRALFGKPTILFLDEPNAHLDINGENRLLQTLAKLRAQGATVIVSTHRTGILEAVDKILLLQDGEVQLYADREAALRPIRPPAAEQQQPTANNSPLANNKSHEGGAALAKEDANAR